MSVNDFLAGEQGQSRSAGSCMTMGTASTHGEHGGSDGHWYARQSSIPAVNSRRLILAQEAGRRIVALVRDDLRVSHILSRPAFENAIRVNGAIGGSTNAVIHLIAIARRLGLDLSLDDWDRLGRNIPTAVDLMPSGHFLMEDFYYAGGLRSVMRVLNEAGLLHREAVGVSGEPLSAIVRDAPNYNGDVIRSLSDPLAPQGGIAVLRGNLAPNGAVIKPSAATRLSCSTPDAPLSSKPSNINTRASKIPSSISMRHA